MDDLISRKAAISTAIKAAIDWHRLANPQYSMSHCIGEAMRKLPSEQTEVIRCKNCRWWDKYNEKHGYCMAAKHGFMSSHWEISIYRTYGEDFFCADAEPNAIEGGDDDKS